MAAQRKKRGTRGAAANYIARSKAIRKLQLSLTDFRRLCILKGIYPRAPRKQLEGRQRTYYLLKDIKFLAHEPLLRRFRDLHAHLRKYRRARARNEPAEAKSLLRHMPTYSLDHLVRERYPTFHDALQDIDDALTLVHLFAQLPRLGRTVDTKRIANCDRLSREWQYAVIKMGALRKVFVSVRGYYFQAEMEGGVKVVWATPHMFKQSVPEDVDVKVMGTFLEFYECLLRFVNFKLYHASLGMKYPPALDYERDAIGGALTDVLRTEPAEGSGRGAPPASSAAGKAAKAAGDTDGGRQRAAGRRTVSRAKVAALEARLAGASRGATLRTGAAGEDAEGGAGVEEDEEDDEEGADEAKRNGADGGGDDAAAGMVLGEGAETAADTAQGYSADQGDADAEEATAFTHPCATLFRGMRFFLYRETPVQVLAFVLNACGADAVGFSAADERASPLDEGDPRVTHVICDRPAESVPPERRRVDREYVQPQWVFDSVNEAFLLPCALYGVGRPLPPHLSPFTSDAAASAAAGGAASGEDAYVPAYREYINRLKAGDANAELPPGVLEAGPRGEGEDGEEEEEEEEEETDEEVDEEAAAAAELSESSEDEGERKAGSGIAGRRDRSGAARRPTSSSADRKELARMMMPRRDRQLYDKMQYGRKRTSKQVDALHRKREELENATMDGAKGKTGAKSGGSSPQRQQRQQQQQKKQKTTTTTTKQKQRQKPKKQK